LQYLTDCLLEGLLRDSGNVLLRQVGIHKSSIIGQAVYLY